MDTQLVLFRNHGDFILLGATRDDAVGEAFDKVAKIRISYPGGPSIAKAAEVGNPRTYSLPKPKLDSPYEFSFSGLKTAVLRAVQHEVGVDITFPSHKLSERLTSAQRNDFAASFQHTAVDILVDATTHAFAREDVASVVIAGELPQSSSERIRKSITDSDTLRASAIVHRQCRNGRITRLHFHVKSRR